MCLDSLAASSENALASVYENHDHSKQRLTRWSVEHLPRTLMVPGWMNLAGHSNNKTLGRAQDPHANGAWLSKLTEWNMKCVS